MDQARDEKVWLTGAGVVSKILHMNKSLVECRINTKLTLWNHSMASAGSLGDRANISSTSTGNTSSNLWPTCDLDLFIGGGGGNSMVEYSKSKYGDLDGAKGLDAGPLALSYTGIVLVGVMREHFRSYFTPFKIVSIEGLARNDIVARKAD